METVSCSGELWLWTGATGQGAWRFVTIGGDAARTLGETAVMRRLEGLSRGFGSLRVVARIGATQWRTSVFPQREGTWLLPVKRAVREAEALADGDRVALTLEF